MHLYLSGIKLHRKSTIPQLMCQLSPLWKMRNYSIYSQQTISKFDPFCFQLSTQYWKSSLNSCLGRWSLPRQNHTILHKQICVKALGMGQCETLWELWHPLCYCLLNHSLIIGFIFMVDYKWLRILYNYFCEGVWSCF